MGSHNETAKLVTELMAKLGPLGWRITKTAKHYRLVPPDPAQPAVILPSSMRPTDKRLALAQLRRSGAPL